MIIGEQVRLRLLERDDLALVAKWRNEERVARQFFGCWPFAVSEQDGWYQAYVKDGSQRMWIVETREGTAIGTLALTSIDQHNQSAELGRVLIGDQNHLAADCAAEAVRMLVRFAFEEANLHRLEVRVLRSNAAALALYKCCGFQQEGVLRAAIWKRGGFEDVVVMSVIRGEGEDETSGFEANVDNGHCCNPGRCGDDSRRL